MTTPYHQRRIQQAVGRRAAQIFAASRPIGGPQTLVGVTKGFQHPMKGQYSPLGEMAESNNERNFPLSAGGYGPSTWQQNRGLATPNDPSVAAPAWNGAWLLQRPYINPEVFRQTQMVFRSQAQPPQQNIGGQVVHPINEQTAPWQMNPSILTSGLDAADAGVIGKPSVSGLRMAPPDWYGAWAPESSHARETGIMGGEVSMPDAHERKETVFSPSTSLTRTGRRTVIGLPGRAFQPDIVSLAHRLLGEGANPDAVAFLCTEVFHNGVTTRALKAKMTRAQMMRAKGAGHKGTMVYVLLLELARGQNGMMSHCCLLCPQESRVEYKNHDDALRHFHKEHFGLAFECPFEKVVISPGSKRNTVYIRGNVF